MLDYASLEAVAMVVREGSFEKAAGVLGITPSAVSQRVRGIEERLGAILVVRSQPCIATDLGAKLCAHIERVKLLESNLTDFIPGMPAGEGSHRFTLNIAVNRDSLGTWFPTATAHFSSKSDALFNIVLDSEEQTVDRLRSGEVIAAVTADGAPVQGCRKMSLGSLRYVATASPSFANKYFGDAPDLATLQRAPMLQVDRQDGLQNRWIEEVFGESIAAPTHWVPSTQGCLDMVLCGLGWGMTPSILARDYLADGRLLELAPYHKVDVDLFWQYSRIKAKLLSEITNSVVTIARRNLTFDGPVAA